jgi:hypothetical protein
MMKLKIAFPLMAMGMALYSMTASAVAETETLTCQPASGVGPVYLIAETSGGAPGFPVDYLSVTRKAAGFADVSASIDLEKLDKNTAVGGVGPFQDGSALVYTRTFTTYDPTSRQNINLGYVTVYTRTTVGASLVDVQLPANVENAALLNTTPPLTGYACSLSFR